MGEEILRGRAVTTGQEQENVKVVLSYLNEVIFGGQFERIGEFVGDRYIQHSPVVGDGVKGLVEFLTRLKDGPPIQSFSIKRVLVDGDFVMLHSHLCVEPGSPGLAVVDIFRMERGRVVEHWDVMQEIPKISQNNNGMF